MATVNEIPLVVNNEEQGRAYFEKGEVHLRWHGAVTNLGKIQDLKRRPSEEPLDHLDRVYSAVGRFTMTSTQLYVAQAVRVLLKKAAPAGPV